MNFLKNLQDTWKRADFKILAYGMLSNWGVVILSNIIGLIFVNTVGIDIVRKLIPVLYLLLGIALYFTSPNSRDFRIGYVLAFVIGMIFLILFYYPLLI